MARKTKRTKLEPPLSAATEYIPSIWVEQIDGTIQADVPDRDGVGTAPDAKSLFVRIRGQRYEHVSEMADGSWVYRKS